jgi:hypothetical protein
MRLLNHFILYPIKIAWVCLCSTSLNYIWRSKTAQFSYFTSIQFVCVGFTCFLFEVVYFVCSNLRSRKINKSNMAMRHTHTNYYIYIYITHKTYNTSKKKILTSNLNSGQFHKSIQAMIHTYIDYHSYTYINHITL